MLVVPSEVMRITRYFVLSICPLLLFLGKVCVVFLLFFVQVALVVATRGRAVRAPVAHANPAEMVPAPSHLLPASHVIAALVFLDMLVASRTLLRVRHEPGHVLRLCIVFIYPLFRIIACTRLVRGQPTRKTGHSTALVALDIVQHLRRVGSLASLPALCIGAPLNV